MYVQCVFIGESIVRSEVKRKVVANNKINLDFSFK